MNASQHHRLDAEARVYKRTLSWPRITTGSWLLQPHKQSTSESCASSRQTAAHPTDYDYFSVGPLKLAVMSVCTLGIYEIYWFYKNWQHIKQRKRSPLDPLLRALFPWLWIFSFVAYLREHAEELGLAVKLSPLWLGLSYWLPLFAWQLPEPYWLISGCSFLPLLYIQQGMEKIMRRGGRPIKKFYRFNRWNGLGIVLGGALFAYAILMP